MCKTTLPNCLGLLLLVTMAALHANEGGDQKSTSPSRAEYCGRYNVIWTSPSQDASGVMPIGNGDIAAGVYAIENGDLFLLLAKNDALTYKGDIYKTGRVRIALDPNPFKAGKAFRQTLDLPSGSITIEADGVRLRIWADAHRPVYHIEIDSPRDLAVIARPEFWKRFDGCDSNITSAALPAGGEPTQDVRLERHGKILWYYAVGDRSVYPDDLKFYQVDPDGGHVCRSLSLQYVRKSPGMLRVRAEKRFAPRRGEVIRYPHPRSDHANAEARDVGRRRSSGRPRSHATYSGIGKPTRPGGRTSGTAAGSSPRTARCRWRLARSFSGEPAPGGLREEEDGAALAAQSYNVFRFLMACQSRGRIQTKFNGGLFTQQLRLKAAARSPRPGAVKQPDGTWLTHEDDRLWGRRFTYQNQRLLYWPLLASGDFDLMKPFFDYYWKLLPMRRAITQSLVRSRRRLLSVRTSSRPAAERDCGNEGRPPKTKPGEKHEGWYHDYYFTSGLETTAMMLDYVNFTGDVEFRDRVLVPFARDVLLFFDQHYARGADGKLRLDPAQVVETWWLAVNPAPDVAGLRFCLDGLLAMQAGTPEDQARWRKFRGEIPEVSLQTIEGRQAIAPAEKWEKRQNFENGELYPVFPFRCFGLALGTGDLVAWTMKHRTFKDAFDCACWTQDQIHWACAGNAAEAAKGLVHRFRVASPMCRFPLYGREGPDSCPDFDHFGAGSVALQRMLVQEAGRRSCCCPRGRPTGMSTSSCTCPAHGAVADGQGRQADSLGHPATFPSKRRCGLPAASRQTVPVSRATEQASSAMIRAIETVNRACAAARK